jgi:hypothetical protein
MLVPVKVAGGAVLQSTKFFPQLTWSAGGAQFEDDFRILQLGGYDGIIGLDWLGKYSPMLTHWEQGWLAIQHQGNTVVLYEKGINNVHMQLWSCTSFMKMDRISPHLFHLKCKPCSTSMLQFFLTQLGYLLDEFMITTFHYCPVLVLYLFDPTELLLS